MTSVAERLDDLIADELEVKASAERRIGQVIAHTYRITRFIGSGGSSHVYEAEHLRLGRRFAVKLLRPELGTGRKSAQRFRREAKAIARLQNEHIVSVVDSGDLDDQALGARSNGANSPVSLRLSVCVANASNGVLCRDWTGRRPFQAVQSNES
jgi:serine/threonine protein kinase